jgi:hypothetical protein
MPFTGDPADAIAWEEARVARLETELKESRAALESLRAELSAGRLSPPTVPALTPSAPAPVTSSEKVALFRSLFRGREDVYPKLWTNVKMSRKGYAPACANEWVRDVCEKPRVKCGECPNQAFLAVEDRADFDKASWTDDVAAFIETCRAVALPAAGERSRSGNGAHVWFFFSAPVAAAAARKMGCYIVTETMARRPLTHGRP